MFRHISLLTLAFCAAAPAQVVVQGGYATQSGPAIPPTPVSPPVMYAPLVRLGTAPQYPINATTGIELMGPAAVSGAVTSEEFGPQAGTSVQIQNPSAMAVEIRPTAGPGAQAAFNFGAAQFQTASIPDMAHQSIAEAARQVRQHKQTTNARTFTNSDIEQINQTGGMVSTPSGQQNAGPANWSPNNGVITPYGSQPAPNAVASPAQQNPPAPQAQGPFAPKEKRQPATTSPSPPQQPPQASARPEHPVELTQSTARNASFPEQQGPNQNHSENTQSDAENSKLPHAGSKLPILGVAGLVSITMGLFVRYQRAKAK